MGVALEIDITMSDVSRGSSVQSSPNPPWVSLLPNHLREKAVPVIVVETSDSEENEAIENFSQPLKIGDAYSYYVSPC